MQLILGETAMHELLRPFFRPILRRPKIVAQFKLFGPAQSVEFSQSLEKCGIFGRVRFHCPPIARQGLSHGTVVGFV